jgi:hypothetical protein
VSVFTKILTTVLQSFFRWVYIRKKKFAHRVFKVLVIRPLYGNNNRKKFVRSFVNSHPGLLTDKTSNECLTIIVSWIVTNQDGDHCDIASLFSL